MESKRRLAAPVQQRCWSANEDTFREVLPLSGEGVVSVNVQRSTAFRIIIQPKEDEEGYVEVEISKSGATLRAKNPSSELKEEDHTRPRVGLEEGKKVSYWFSFNRDDRVLKYGKGYIMEETTLLMQRLPFPKKEEHWDPWEFIFRPDTTKKIVIRDVAEIEALAMLEHPEKRETFLSLSQDEMKDQATQAYRLNCQDEEISKLVSLVELEKKVSFYPHPLKVNWPPLVLDSSKATLEKLSTNCFTLSASLPAICRELYENVRSPSVTLDWPYKNPTLPDVINYSLKTKGKILHNKLEEKKKNGEFQYLRVNVGIDRGCSPGIPYELEIWPPGVSSPIHSHGNAYAVEKVLYGAIKFKIYNKTWEKGECQEHPLMSFTATQGEISWMSPNWYQTHMLENVSKELFCATLQCYKYGKDDELMWPYFDYLKDKEVKEFLPEGDFQSFEKLKDCLLDEYQSNHPECDILPVV